METTLQRRRRTQTKSSTRDAIRALVSNILATNQWIRTSVLVAAAQAAFPNATEKMLRESISRALVEGELSHRYERDYGLTKLAAPRRSSK